MLQENDLGLQKSNMHIAFLLPDLRGGGAQKMIVNLANWCAGQGHKVSLILLSDTGIYHDLIAHNITVINFQKTRSLFAINALTRYLKIEQPDILISALYYVNIVALISRMVTDSSTKIVISERNHVTCSFNSMHSTVRFMWGTALRVFYPLSNQIIGISNGVCEDLKTLLPANSHARIKKLYNPVITNQFNVELHSAAPDIFPQRSQVKLIASGRLVKQKDYPTMLRAFACIVEKNPTAYLVILGSGPLEGELQALRKTLGLEEHVHFQGFVQNPIAYMKQADMFIITSAWEGFGNVIVEALYCGLKIVATDCPSGPSEILRNGEYGTLCSVGDVKQIAEAVDNLKNKHVSVKKLKERALNFHVDQIGSELINYVRELQN